MIAIGLCLIEGLNIAFEYPRSDTYSFCNKTNIKINNTQSEFSKAFEKGDILKGIQKLEVEQKLHLTKADIFYKRKIDA